MLVFKQFGRAFHVNGPTCRNTRLLTSKTYKITAVLPSTCCHLTSAVLLLSSATRRVRRERSLTARTPSYAADHRGKISSCGWNQLRHRGFGVIVDESLSTASVQVFVAVLLLLLLLLLLTESWWTDAAALKGVP